MTHTLAHTPASDTRAIHPVCTHPCERYIARSDAQQHVFVNPFIEGPEGINGENPGAAVKGIKGNLERRSVKEDRRRRQSKHSLVYSSSTHALRGEGLLLKIEIIGARRRPFGPLARLAISPHPFSHPHTSSYEHIIPYTREHITHTHTHTHTRITLALQLRRRRTCDS